MASEQEIIARFAAEQAAGVGFNDIARQLNAEGIRAKQGGLWSGRVVSMVLQREGKYKVPQIQIQQFSEVITNGNTATHKGGGLRQGKQ